jgi:glycosyltransferase involved in cell wall biosynthesis
VAYVLPSKPRPEFVETFGIALVEKMLSGGGPVITTDTGGIGEAVGGCALIVPVEDPAAIARALNRVVLEMSVEERGEWERRAREHGRRFDRSVVLDGVLARVGDLERDEAPRARLRLV